MKKVYFASDFHLGAPSYELSRARELRVCAWLDEIKEDAEAIYLVGDIFDFWFEYKHVIPKGFVRFFGKIAELSDKNIPIHFFVGNHDIWMKDYLAQELGVKVHHKPLLVTLGEKQFFIAHGDGLGPYDYGYKRLKKVFTNPLCQWLFKWLHPDLGTAIAGKMSKSSRAAQHEPEFFLGRDKEWLLQYSERKLNVLPQTDYFVFGHRHLPLCVELSNKRTHYVNLGEWFDSDTYAVFDGEELSLKSFRGRTKPPAHLPYE
jgi:UDP-2,3-diacylglucosamine hydrolase